MRERHNGGPAFPIDTKWNSHGEIMQRGQPGMSLRDWFATHASEDDLDAHRGYGPGKTLCSREEAKYRYADAMLAARKAGGR